MKAVGVSYAAETFRDISRKQQVISIYARAVVLREGSHEVALVAMDLAFLDDGMVRDALALDQGLGLSDANVIVGATHTHGAQAGYTMRRQVLDAELLQNARESGAEVREGAGRVEMERLAGVGRHVEAVGGGHPLEIVGLPAAPIGGDLHLHPGNAVVVDPRPELIDEAAL